MSDIEFELTKTCPFLDRICIGHECPSFTWEHVSWKKTTQDVVLVTKKKKRFKTIETKKGMGVLLGWEDIYIPLCQVLNNKSCSSLFASKGVHVGIPFKSFSETTPRWVKTGMFGSSLPEVEELPEIKNSSFETKGDKNES